LTVANTTARKPRTVVRVDCPEPATRTEPMRVIPEIAFVLEMSGVWRVAGILVISS